MNDRLVAAALGAFAGYAIARQMQARAPEQAPAGGFVYAPPKTTITGLADIAAALYPPAVAPLRAVARAAELLEPPCVAYLIEHGGRYSVTICPPPRDATILATATGRTPAEAAANLKT